MNPTYYFAPNEHIVLDMINTAAHEFMQIGAFSRDTLNSLLGNVEPYHAVIFAWLDTAEYITGENPWHACWMHIVDGVITRNYISPEGYATKREAFAAALRIAPGQIQGSN